MAAFRGACPDDPDRATNITFYSYVGMKNLERKSIQEAGRRLTVWYKKKLAQIGTTPQAIEKAV